MATWRYPRHRKWARCRGGRLPLWSQAIAGLVRTATRTLDTAAPSHVAVMGTVARGGPFCQTESSCAGAKLVVRTLPTRPHALSRPLQTAAREWPTTQTMSQTPTTAGMEPFNISRNAPDTTQHSEETNSECIHQQDGILLMPHVPVSTPIPINAKTPPKRHNATFLLVRRPSPVQHIVNCLSRIPLGLDEETAIPRRHDAGCVLLREAGVHDGRLVAQLGADVRGDAVDGTDDDEAGEDGFWEAAVGKSD